MTTQVVDLSVPDDIARAVILPASYGDLDGTVYPARRWLRANLPLGKAEIAVAITGVALPVDAGWSDF